MVENNSDVSNSKASAHGKAPLGVWGISNRLQYETSPYLLQHAHNPVDWYPWGEEAFEKAGIKDGEFNIAKASEMADPEIGTLTEFTGEMNKKIGCHGPQHPSRPGR